MWYYAQNGKTFGPVSVDKLKELAQSGGLRPADHIVPVGSQEWKPASSMPELFPAPPPKTPAAVVPPPMTQEAVVTDRPPPRPTVSAGPPGPPPPMPEALTSQSWSLNSEATPRPGFEPPGLSFWRRVGRHFKRLYSWNLQRLPV